MIILAQVVNLNVLLILLLTPTSRRCFDSTRKPIRNSHFYMKFGRSETSAKRSAFGKKSKSTGNPPTNCMPKFPYSQIWQYSDTELKTTYLTMLSTLAA